MCSGRVSSSCSTSCTFRAHYRIENRYLWNKSDKILLSYDNVTNMYLCVRGINCASLSTSSGSVLTVLYFFAFHFINHRQYNRLI